MSRSVAIVIPARNEGDNVRSTVRSIIDNKSGVSQIIVVDDASTDGCCDGLPPGVEVLAHSKRQGASVARITGAKANNNPYGYLCFLDSHMEVTKGWIQNLIAVLEDNPNVAVVGPAIHDVNDQSLWGAGVGLQQWAPPIAWEWEYPEDVQIVGMLPGGCQLWKADAYKAIGGYSPLFVPIGGEDLEISIRTWLRGYDLAAVPTAHVSHSFHSRIPNAEDHPAILANELRLSVLHLSAPRLFRVYEQMKDWPAVLLETVWQSAHGTATVAGRRENQRLNKRTDTEWFEQFSPDNEIAQV